MTKVFNPQTHDLLTRQEVFEILEQPDVELDLYYDLWDSDEDDGFFIREDSLYHINEFMRFQDPDREEEMQGWDGYQTWTYFSGLVIRWHLDEHDWNGKVETAIYQA